jgi:hypothetical protein
MSTPSAITAAGWWVAPAGDLTIWGDATIDDDGKIDPADFGAVEVPVAELPDSCLLYLMGSRYRETDKLSQTALSHQPFLLPTTCLCARRGLSESNGLTN